MLLFSSNLSSISVKELSLNNNNCYTVLKHSNLSLHSNNYNNNKEK